MSDLFCFGTLRHLPLLETVLGQIGHLTISPARLPQFEILAVQEGPFPMLRPRAGAEAEGILLSGLSADDWARLDYYEGAFDYGLRDVTLVDGRAAQCYFPPDGQFADAGAWDLPGWQRLWGQTSCFAAREVMGYLGTKVASEVAVMFPNIRARAWAAVNAEQSRHGAGCFAGRVVVEKRQRSYAKFYALDDFEIRHEQFDGTMTPPLSRASFIGTDAAIVLPYDPRRDCVALVEQIRVGPLARGDRQLWQLEPIAGRIDAGEAPDETARREAMEEAGITITDLHAVAETYASPGCSSEFFYVYVGIADLGALAGRVGGLDSEHEDIKTHVMPFERLMALCSERRAANAPLVMAAYWLAHHRAALLRSGGALVRDETTN